MKIVIVETGKAARIAEIEPTLQVMQAIVDGNITAVYPFEDRVALVANDEGMYTKPLNRAIGDGCIFGDFFICGLTDEDFGGLTDAQAQKYARMFRYPHTFTKINGVLTGIDSNGYCIYRA